MGEGGGGWTSPGSRGSHCCTPRVTQIRYISSAKDGVLLRIGNNLDLMQGLVEHDSGLQGAAGRRTVDAMIATSGWRKALPSKHWFAVLAAGRPAYGGARLQCLWCYSAMA